MSIWKCMHYNITLDKFILLLGQIQFVIWTNTSFGTLLPWAEHHNLTLSRGMCWKCQSAQFNLCHNSPGENICKLYLLPWLRPACDPFLWLQRKRGQTHPWVYGDSMVIVWIYGDSMITRLSLHYAHSVDRSCQDHILTENIWFVWSWTSYSGLKWRCHYAGRVGRQTTTTTTNKGR